MADIAGLTADIRSAISAAATGPPRPERKFNKDDEFVAYGLNVPAWRAVMRAFRPRFRGLSLDQRLDLAEALLHEGEGWLGHSGIHLLALSVGDLEPQHFHRLDRMADSFTGWSHVDDFCIAAVSRASRRDAGPSRALEPLAQPLEEARERGRLCAEGRAVGRVHGRRAAAVREPGARSRTWCERAWAGR